MRGWPNSGGSPKEEASRNEYEDDDMNLACLEIARAALGQPAKTAGSERHFHCPGHDDRHPSLQVNARKNAWLCGPCGQGGNAWELAAFIAGLDPADKLAVMKWLGDRGILPAKVKSPRSSSNGRIVAEYNYRGADGKLLYQVVREQAKKFKQRRPDGKGGWIWNLQGVRLVPYRLADWINRVTVYVVEGEKDADALWAMGIPATTCPMGAGKWRAEYDAHFKGKRVVILSDNDDAGEAHARDIARHLLPVAKSVKTVRLPGLPDKGDFSDWKAAGGTREKLVKLVRSTPELPAADVEASTNRDASTNQETSTEAGSPYGQGNALRYGKEPSQADQLVELVAGADGVELFHTPAMEAYATVPVSGHRETWPLKSSGFRRWLVGRFYAVQGKAPRSQARQDAIVTLEAQAVYGGRERFVFMRLGGFGDAIYLDLANSSWEAVEISPSGWRIVHDPPIRFRRARGMLPLPHPVNHDSVHELQEFLNLESENNQVLVLAWLVAALRPNGPYPILCLHGEQGSAKTTNARVLRELVDPSTSSSRALPQDNRDLMIAACNGWVISFDNLSRLPEWLSDALCRLATGGGFSTRQLYTDDEEMIFDAQRPVILNGIEELATRGDLLERAIIVNLPQIDDVHRKDEAQFWRTFYEVRPRILGGLLRAVSVALQGLPDARRRLHRMPRMADFALLATAAEPGLQLQQGAFMVAYEGNRESANDLVLESSSLAQAVQSLAEGSGFQGTSSQLLVLLNKRVDEDTRRQREWPRNTKALTGVLKRLAPNLRACGILVDRWRGNDRKRTRMVRLEKLATNLSATSEVSERPEFSPKLRTDAEAQRPSVDESVDIPEQTKNTVGKTDADDADTSIPTFSNLDEEVHSATHPGMVEETL